MTTGCTGCSWRSLPVITEACVTIVAMTQGKNTIKRLSALAAGLALASLGLAACQTTTYTCNNNECTVNLSGSGASTEVGTANTEVALIGADGTTASFTIDGAAAECTEGETLNVSGISVTCTEVGDDSLSVDLR